MISIRVPATSANLGPGFDCLGLALQIYNTFDIEENDQLLLENVEERFNNRNNLFVKAFEKVHIASVHAVFNCDIPVSRGLGSSAAMITAGAAAAMILCNGRIDKNRLFEIAAEMEGHPDNAAPCIYGGLTACMQKKDHSYLMRSLKIAKNWKFTVLIPDHEVSTEKAREILPDSYPRSIASANAAHAVLMCQALETGELDLLVEAADDQIHEPYRSQLIPHFNNVKAITEADQKGKLLISGSGSTCLFISKGSLSMQACNTIQSLPEHWSIQETSIALQGIQRKVNGKWQEII